MSWGRGRREAMHHYFRRSHSSFWKTLDRVLHSACAVTDIISGRHPAWYHRCWDCFSRRLDYWCHHHHHPHPHPYARPFGRPRF